ncbi:MAG TPA: peptidylprolyl isomerase [Pirellulales bacterium]
MSPGLKLCWVGAIVAVALGCGHRDKPPRPPWAKNIVEPVATQGTNGESVIPPIAQTVSQKRPKPNYLSPLEEALRAAEAKADDLPRVLMSTTKGDLVLELYENEAPNTVANFVSLVEKGFYNGLTFHRVLDGFMAQGGCPKGTGSGDPGYKIACECYKPNARKHFPGSLSMANAGRDTNGSQFFLTFEPTPMLNGKHTVFGRVIQGEEVLDRLQRIDPDHPEPGLKPDKIVSATVIRKRNHDYTPDKVSRF